MSNEDSSKQQSETTPAKSGTTVLRVETSWCTGFTFPGEDGDTLVIDRKGVEVPTKDAEALIKTADEHGVKIVEVSEK